MSKELFESLSIFSIFIGTAVFIMVSYEVGYQNSKYTQSHREGKVDTSQAPIVGGILALLAFVLAFTFNMTSSRFDDRKKTVLAVFLYVHCISKSFTITICCRLLTLSFYLRLTSSYVTIEFNITFTTITSFC